MKNNPNGIKMERDILYLLEKYNKTSGLFMLNHKYVFVEQNLHKYNADGIETEFLTLKTSINIEAIGNDPTFMKGNYNLIIFKSEEVDVELENFFKLCQLYSKNNDYMFKDFFTSLYNIFQSKKVDKNLNLLGLWGELYVMIYLKNKLNIDLSNSWHTFNNDKYDFVFNQYPLEVKTTKSKEKLLTLKHDQIFNNQEKILVGVFCESNNSGISVYDLIKLLNKNKLIEQNINFQLKLQQELIKINQEDMKNIKFKLKEIKFFNSKDLPTILNIPENILNISYQYSCEGLKCIENKDLKNILENHIINTQT